MRGIAQHVRSRLASNLQGGFLFQWKGNIISTIMATTVYIRWWQSFEILLYGADAWRKAALDDGIEIIGRCDNPNVVVYLPSERVNFIAPHFWEVSVVLATIFGSSQHHVVSELIARGKIGFYLTVCWGSLPLLEHIVSAFRFAIICILLHYMLDFVSKSEIIKRMWKFQAFR